MSDKTGIEWTDETWNPVTGCSRVSAGCAHCYAETFAERWRGVKGHHFEQGFDLKLWPDRLAIPLKQKRPRKIFVNSMSDLFHEGVPFEFVDQVVAVMLLSQQHTFQVLTKRPQRMLEYFGQGTRRWENINLMARYISGKDGIAVLPTQAHGMVPLNWPLKNLWLGVSVENQAAADERIPLLIQTPAAVRFLSCEPLLGPVNIHQKLPCGPDCWTVKLDWVICGGESGPGARPMKTQWASSLKDQCKISRVPFFMKQLGGPRDKRGDLELFPENLKVRQFPHS